METVTDIAIQDCFVIHVLDNRLPAVQCSQALTPLPETLRASLHRYLLALLKPQFRRKRYGRFRPESVVLQAYQQMLASRRQQGRSRTTEFLAASQAIAARLFDVMRQSPREWLPPPSRHHHTRGSVGGAVSGHGPAASARTVALPHQGGFGIGSVSGRSNRMALDGVQTILTARDGLMPKLSTEKVQKFALIRFVDDPPPTMFS